MIKLLPILVFFLSIAGASAQDPNVAGAGGLHAKLQELQEEVGQSPAREIEFREERSFPFRKNLVSLQGVLRLWNGEAVSIEYPEKRNLLIADDEGLLMRKFSKSGSVFEKAGDAEASDTIGLLRAAFEFDQVELEKRFVMEWEETADGWRVLMTPREEEESSLRMVTLAGEDRTLSSISLYFEKDRKITIFPTNETLKDGFSEEERDRYFRSAR